jgi:tetratricopeptide (TPR) repeat protein
MARRTRFGVFLLLSLLPSVFAQDFDLDKCKAHFLAGDYAAVIEQAGGAVKARERGEDWPLLYANALWMTGKYPEAKEAITAAQRFNYYSIRIRLLAYKIYRSNGDLDESAGMLDEINGLGGSRRWGYRDPADLVALGEAAVLLGADPKLVLDNFFTPVKKSNPNLREVYLAIGKLALDKHDYALAGKAFQEGLQKFPKDPELLYGMAEALTSSERKDMLSAIESVFKANKNHIGARLLLVEHLVDAEEYDEAEKELKKIEAVNPSRPEMWAYRAVIAHLRNDDTSEQNARNEGLKFWKTNPEVDHIIGRKLSQKYRFAEGSVYQRRAVQFDPRFLPARIQLAQDLLRLGEEDEGWQLADQVSKADAYDISAYNLMTLHDSISKFQVLTNEHFTLRMENHEAMIYGQQALELLEKARTTLTKKYGLDLTNRTTVEIFPQQKDFAVRTFGMPGGEGYLGVCFGSVITANSPATHNMNWHSVLWHEFCHVVTLHLTENKMPRWLSEGISVYEERRADARCGEQLDPKYREFIMTGKMKPISDMSSAFMAPPSGIYLQFAYYQSSLVVEFIIERYGLDAIKAILRDLGEGKPINDALAAHTTEMAALEKDFEAFAKGAAETLGPNSVWEKPKRDEDGNIDATWAGFHPDNYWVVSERAGDLLEKHRTAEAIPLLEKSIAIYPRQSGGENAYASLAQIYRQQKESEKERQVLNQWSKLDGDAGDPLFRLIELDTAAHDDKAALKHATELLQVNPLSPIPYRARAEAAEHTGHGSEAITSYRTELLLDPPDRPEIHYRLARLLQKENTPIAKRHVLLALEEAPRFRAAHELLLQIAEAASPEKNVETASGKNQKSEPIKLPAP